MARWVVVLSTFLVLLPSVARADSSRFVPTSVAVTDLADATGATAMSAAGGHVVFSRAVAAHEYQLVDWSAGAGLRVLPAGTRAAPFDADAGTDVQGHPVVTYSTCQAHQAGAVLLRKGCALNRLRLDRASARPTPLRLHGDRGLSLSTPSAHEGSVVAVAAPARGSHNVRILYWSTTSSTPRRLSGGTARCLYSTCPGGPDTMVDALDLGPRSVTFVWDQSSGGIGTGATEELRAAALSGRPSRQVGRAAGYVSGACGYRRPESPNALTDGSAGFVLIQSPCDSDQTTIARWAPGARDFLGARPSGTLVGGAAWDGEKIYWLSCVAIHDVAYNADVISSACRLVVSTNLALRAARLQAHG
jgi:hypothetical protein